jgi:GTP-binding protein HflX
MNLMSGTDVLADAMPFATLDPTTRKVEFTDGYAFFLTDTVGFIRNLPTGLVAAFRATLEEVTFADFILHIVDVSHPVWDMQRDAVLDTLDALKASEMPCITVFNKIDAMEDRSILTDLISSTPNSVGISALTGEGIPDLMSHIKVMIQKHLRLIYALVPYNEAGLVDTCYKKGRVLRHEFLEGGIYIEAELVDELRSLLERYEVEPMPAVEAE